MSSTLDTDIVNSMTKKEIIFFLSDMKRIDDPDASSPGRNRLHRPACRQRRFVYNRGDMWLNKRSFSWTKQGFQGYPTLPLRSRKKAKSENGSTCQQKQPSCTRVLVHKVMWRLWNDFKTQPSDTEISHLTSKLAVGPANLCCESGVRNKHRIGCHGATIQGESCKCGLESAGIPFCRNISDPTSVQGFFDVDDAAVRDEKAALKELPSSGELCETCLCEKNPNLDLMNCAVGDLLKYCLCDGFFDDINLQNK